MKKADIRIGGVYRAKVSDKVTDVRIDAENPHGGWDATNLATKKKIRIKSAQRLRTPAMTQAQASAVAAADQENARVRDSREASRDGMTASERAMANSSQCRRANQDKSRNQPDATAADAAAHSEPNQHRSPDMAATKTARTKKPTKKAPAKKTGKTTKKKAPARTTTKRAPARSAPKKRNGTSLLDAAATVLAKAKEPMSCPEMVEAVVKAKTWSSSGKTPAATLSAAIHREIKTKGKEARFAKAERGRFRVTAAGSGKRQRSK